MLQTPAIVEGSETSYAENVEIAIAAPWSPEFYFRYFRILSGTDDDLDLDLMSSYLERYEVSEDELGVI